MCLAVPMVIVELRERDQAVAELGGARCDIDISLVEGVAVGDHVIVHAGFAIERLDVEEAEATLALFAEMASAGDATDSGEPRA